MSFINTILLVICLCLGIRTISDTDKLLEPFKNWLGEILPLYLWMPLIGCIACMASFWGTITFWSLYFIYPTNAFKLVFVAKWISTCIISSFGNELCWTILLLFRKRI